MNILDTYGDIEALCAGGSFAMDPWSDYIRSISPSLEALLWEDVKQTLATGAVTFDKDYLPVLNGAWGDPAARAEAHRSFLALTDGLEQTIEGRFGRCPDCDIIFYLGLCNGAGWVTELDGRRVILLGLEKIVELGWTDRRAMAGLIDHELGHSYQGQFGVLKRETATPRERFLWQLFTEGIAMVFEQTLLEDPQAFHQYDNAWRVWCDRHFREIRSDFEADLDTMTFANQRYFGDWVRYRGHGDVGYYLGARLIRYAMAETAFDELICWDPDRVQALWQAFLTAD